MSNSCSNILKRCRENVNDFSCEPPKKKKRSLKSDDWTLSEMLDAQSQGSSPLDLDLNGRGRLLPMENDSSSEEAQPNGLGVIYKSGAKELQKGKDEGWKEVVRKNVLNTKQEAIALIQSINTIPQQVPPQTLVFDPSFNILQLSHVRELGSGSFGVTDLYEDEHQRKFVRKTLIRRDKWNVIEPNEVLIPLELTEFELFPSVVGLEWTGEEAIIFQEFAGENLYDCLGDVHFRKRLDKDEHLVRWIMLQIFRELKMLHKHGVVHRDIKLENVCIDLNDRDRVRIIDFGLARTMQDLYSETYEGATPECLPPDVSYNIINRIPPVFRARYESADVCNAGIVAFSLRMKNPDWFPFFRNPDQGNNMDECRHIVQSEHSYPEDPLLRNLIKNCLQVNKNNPPTAEKVVHCLEGKLNLGEEEPKPKKMTMLNEKDKQRMNSLLKKSDFDNMKVPGRSFSVLGIQKDLRDPNVLAAGQQKLNNIFSMAVASPPSAPPPALPQHVVVEKEKLLPNGHAQATMWNVCPSPEYMEVGSDSTQSLEDMDIGGDERPYFDTPQLE